MSAGQPWPWPETMDAPLAAPASHRVLLENDRVWVLEGPHSVQNIDGHRYHAIRVELN